MINSLTEVTEIARDKGPKKLAVLAPEDAEFMSAVKQGYERGLIEPILIGDPVKIKKVAADVAFQTEGLMVIAETNRQAVADLGTRMLFEGRIDMESKGQIPTAFVYRSIIREEAKIGSGRIISVVTFWEIPDLKRLIAFSDTGVNIKPDYKAKAETIKNAVFAMQLLGCERPRVAVLSARREINRNPESYRHFLMLKRAAQTGDLGNCEISDMNCIGDFFQKGRDPSDMPEVLLVPSLDTGNILCKFDFFLNVTRRSVVITSRGPVLIPSRSDFCSSIFGEVEMGVVMADRIKGGGLR